MKNKQQIPKGWQDLKLKSLTTKIGSGITPKGGEEVYQDSGVMFLRSQNVQNGFLELNNVAYISEAIDHNMASTRLEKNDVLYNITGASIGRSAIYDKSERANVNQHVCIVRLSNSSPSFINYFLISQKGQRELYSFQAGGNRQGLNFQQLGSFKLSIPPLPEQFRIVEVLQTWNKYLEKLDKKIDIKKNIKRGLMQKLLSGDKRLSGFSGEWQHIKICDFCEVFRGGSPRPIAEYLTTETDGINWLRIGDIDQESKYVVKTKEKIKKSGKNKTTIVNEGDFIISNSMSFGRPYIMKIQSAIHDGWLTLKNISSKVNKEFLFYLLNTSKVQNEFENLAAGSGVRNLNKDIVKEVSLILPGINEQKAIANILITSDKEIEKLEEKMNIIKEQKRFLLNNLITGKIRMPEFVN